MTEGEWPSCLSYIHVISEVSIAMYRMGNCYIVAQCEAVVMCGNIAMYFNKIL